MSSRKNPVSSVFDRLRLRRQRKDEIRASGVREVLVLLAAERRGEAEVELDADYAADVIEQAGLTEQDVEANISLINRRHAAAALASRAETLRQAAADAEERFTAADLAEGRRHRDALADVRALEVAAHRASGESQAAIVAVGDLYSTSEPTSEEQRLSAQQRDLAREIKAAQLRLDPTSVERTEDGRAIFGLNNPNWHARPALALALKREELAKAEAAGRPRAKEDREVVAQLANAVEDVQRHLVRLQGQEAKLAAEIAKVSKARAADPNAFRMVRSQPTADDHRRQHAVQQGLQPNAWERGQ